MDACTKLRGLSIAILAVLVLAGLGGVPASAAAEDSDATVRSSMLLVLQGENDIAAGDEGRDDFYALKIISFDLPYDEARVYTTVPQDAHDVNVWFGANTLGQSQYGREPSGIHADEFYIDVPTSHVRTNNYSVTAASLADFTTSGSLLTNLNYTSGALRLSDESAMGTYISPNISIPSSVSIRSLLLAVNGNSTGNITSHVSTDGGGTWWSVQNDTALNVTSSGTTLQVMFELTSNTTLGYDTSLSSFLLTAVYVPTTTIFAVHVSYLWTAEFTDGKTVLDVSEPLPFSSNGSYIIMLYTLPGYVPTGTGVQLVFDSNGTMNTYDDKDLYLSTTYPVEAPSYSVEISAPKTSSNLWLYSAVALVALSLAGTYAYMNSRTRRPGRVQRPEPDDELADAPASADNETRKMELVGRKKEMLAEIENIKSSLSTGAVTQAAAAAELARIKKEFKGVRNELNRLSRKTAGPAADAGPSSNRESVIAALARIDDDFEKGRLPESTYKTLRKEYVQKAASMMATHHAADVEALSPLDKEKNKLMGAIVALDDEREKGAIDERVYSDLRASYRTQLADLMRKAEESKEGEE